MLYRSIICLVALLASLAPLQASAIAVTDVSFRIGTDPYEYADDAVLFSGSNDSISGLNAVFGGDPWQLLDKTDDEPTAIADVLFTVDADVDLRSGAWQLSWSGPGLPAVVDLMFVTKAAGKWGAYLFDDMLFTANPSSGDGTFEISWRNQGGNVPRLSHASVYGRVSNAPVIEEEATGNDLPPGEVPVPGSVLLFGLGLGLLARRLAP